MDQPLCSRQQTQQYVMETFDTDSQKEAQTQPQAGKVMLTILECARAYSRTYQERGITANSVITVKCFGT